MENENMRDNEMEKSFSLNRKRFNLFVAGRLINPESMTNDPVFNLTPRHCFCVCFSKKKDDIELYRAFKADICIGFDVDKLKEHLEVIGGRFPGLEFRGKDVTYYHPGTPPDTFTREELVFYKPSRFSHEAEYRLALFYPEYKTGFKTQDGTVIPFMKESESMHMSIGHLEKGFISDCVVEVFHSKR
ncbi:hypothetical protein J8Z83_22400 [Yersinia enterocolitica]|nr:hypothetical protein [Yersinia enterocolitica]MBX9477370.1 hypothetical protein [Yersinia enterocolitica]